MDTFDFLGEALDECLGSTCGPRSNGWELLIQRLGVVNIFKLIFDIKTDILVEKFELKILNFKIKLKMYLVYLFGIALKRHTTLLLITSWNYLVDNKSNKLAKGKRVFKYIMSIYVTPCHFFIELHFHRTLWTIVM